jgi:hypothetical protein
MPGARVLYRRGGDHGEGGGVTAIRDLLDRFRPAGAPGAPGPAGVPADRRLTAALELEPVFAALADTVAECASVRAQAIAEAGRRQEAADERARALVSRAHTEAASERAATAAGLMADAAVETTRVLDRAAQEADQVRRRARDRRPDLIARAMSRLRTDLAALTGDRP